MSKFARRLSRVRIVALFAVVSLVAASQAAASAPASGTRGRLARAVKRVLKDGLQAKIPPHVSEMLGISEGLKECTVAQRFERNGKLVRGFNVSTTHENDVVLFVTNEATNEQTYYLTSRLGGLRRVMAVREGTGNVLRVTSKEKAAFEKELQFWLDRIVPVRTSGKGS